ncbi:MAG: polysaccharide deacetylase family protein [Alphaproteobacteria bacterium]
MRNHLFYILIFFLTAFFFGAAPAQAGALEQDNHSAVILAYYRVGEDSSGDANLTAEQFLAHIREIKEEGYNVIGLPQLIDAFEADQAIPERTLVITFQGAYKSALQNAIPALLSEKMPFTVFYAGAQADSAAEDMMNWDDLHAVSRHEGVTLGLLPDSYERLAHMESADIKREVNNALLKFRKNFKSEPQFFTYPYGEYSQEFKSIVKTSGFRAALGLQSGAAYAGGDLYGLPRFSMSGAYGDLERFHLVAQALPFPVYDLEPADSFADTATPIGFSVPETLQKDLKDISCFISGEDKPDIEIIGNRVELRAQDVLNDERARINCTLPSGFSSDYGPRWRWFGMLLAGQG